MPPLFENRSESPSPLNEPSESFPEPTPELTLVNSDEEPYETFDLKALLKYEKEISAQKKRERKESTEGSTSSDTASLSSNSSFSLRLTGGAAKTYLSGIKFNSQFRIRNRDFQESSNRSVENF